MVVLGGDRDKRDAKFSWLIKADIYKWDEKRVKTLPWQRKPLHHTEFYARPTY